MQIITRHCGVLKAFNLEITVGVIGSGPGNVASELADGYQDLHVRLRDGGTEAGVKALGIGPELGHIAAYKDGSSVGIGLEISQDIQGVFH